MKQRVIPLLLFFFAFSVPSLLLVQARLPEFTGQYLIDNMTPRVSNQVTITVFVNIYDPDGQQIPFGALSMFLMWSRDQISWKSVSMTTLDFQTFTGVLPKQDGTENRHYDYGAGPMYWYCLMRNDRNEESTFFTTALPNSEIVYEDPWATTTVAVEGQNGVEQPPTIFDPIFSVIGSLLDPATDPFVRISLISVIGIVVFLLASRGQGLGFLSRTLRGLFK